MGAPIQFTNTSTAGASYTWYFGDGSPADTSVNPLHTYAVDGLYNVILIVRGQGPCANDTMTLQINCLYDGISDLAANASVVLVPNPATDEISFSSAKSLQSFHLTIYDLSGKIILDRSECNVNDKLNVANFDRGVYFYRLYDEKGVPFKVGRLILN
jgi:PKD repeat protein